MHNLFTKHPKENGHSGFFSHLFFSSSIAVRMAIATCVFTVHAFFPFIPIPKFLNLEMLTVLAWEKHLEMTIQYLIRKNLDTL